MLIANLLVIGWLFLCKWASVHDPSLRPTLLSLVSFSCFFAFIGNLTFIIVWLFSKRKARALLSAGALALCWPIVSPLFGVNYLGKNIVAPYDEGGLKIMTWNVHMFDLGEWTQDKASRGKILKLIKEENPDILCLQEFYWDEKDNREPYTALLQQLGYPFTSFSRERTMKKNYMTIHARSGDMISVGHAIFSKYPLRNEQSYDLNNAGYKMLSVEAYIDSSHIFNLNVVHLTSVGFGDEEMQYISSVKKKGVDAPIDERSKSLLKKLRDASAKRAMLANMIDSLKRRMDYPIIICGDFNDVPSSYVYSKVKGELSDAFMGKGMGFGRTYTHIFPTLRIDYILYDKEALTLEGYKSPFVGLSDHYPVIANFSLPNAKNPIESAP